jgi:hypothetical protein
MGDRAQILESYPYGAAESSAVGWMARLRSPDKSATASVAVLCVPRDKLPRTRILDARVRNEDGFMHLQGARGRSRCAGAQVVLGGGWRIMTAKLPRDRIGIETAPYGDGSRWEVDVTFPSSDERTHTVLIRAICLPRAAVPGHVIRAIDAPLAAHGFAAARRPCLPGERAIAGGFRGAVSGYLPVASGPTPGFDGWSFTLGSWGTPRAWVSAVCATR